MKIRRAKKEDLKLISNIFKEEFRKPPYKERWTKEEASKRINNYSKRGIIFVLEEKEEIAGFIIGSTYKLWDDILMGSVDEVVISSKFQNKGFGNILLTKLEGYFKKNRIKNLSLTCNRKSNAFKFYKKQKYIIDKNKIFMKKKLN